MKRTLKTIIAVLLVTLLAGSVTSQAAQKDDHATQILKKAIEKANEWNSVSYNY